MVTATEKKRKLVDRAAKKVNKRQQQALSFGDPNSQFSTANLPAPTPQAQPLITQNLPPNLQSSQLPFIPPPNFSPAQPQDLNFLQGPQQNFTPVPPPPLNFSPVPQNQIFTPAPQQQQSGVPNPNAASEAAFLQLLGMAQQPQVPADQFNLPAFLSRLVGGEANISPEQMANTRQFLNPFQLPTAETGQALRLLALAPSQALFNAIRPNEINSPIADVIRGFTDPLGVQQQTQPTTATTTSQPNTDLPLPLPRDIQTQPDGTIVPNTPTLPGQFGNIQLQNTRSPDGRPVLSLNQVGPGTVTLADAQNLPDLGLPGGGLSGGIPNTPEQRNRLNQVLNSLAISTAQLGNNAAPPLLPTNIGQPDPRVQAANVTADAAQQRQQQQQDFDLRLQGLKNQQNPTLKETEVQNLADILVPLPVGVTVESLNDPDLSEQDRGNLIRQFQDRQTGEDVIRSGVSNQGELALLLDFLGSEVGLPFLSALRGTADPNDKQLIIDEIRNRLARAAQVPPNANNQ